MVQEEGALGENPHFLIILRSGVCLPVKLRIQRHQDRVAELKTCRCSPNPNRSLNLPWINILSEVPINSQTDFRCLGVPLKASVFPLRKRKNLAAKEPLQVRLAGREWGKIPSGSLSK